MKILIIILSSLIALSLSAPSQNAQITRYVNNNDGNGNYHFAFDQSDGTRREESGSLQSAGRGEPGIAMRGSFSYTGPDNVVYTVNYVADANGFQPEGAHLPQASQGSSGGSGRRPSKQSQSRRYG